MEITHLQCDDLLIKEICSEYLQDSSFNGTTLPVGVILDPNTGLYWLTGKVFVPNALTLKNKRINEFHNIAGHPDYERPYSVILRNFYWPNLRKDVKSFVKLCPKTNIPY